MQIGFLTNCFRRRTLPEVIAWAGANGFHTLELECKGPRDDQPNPTLNAARLDRAGADALLALAAQHDVSFSCLSCCDNTLEHDPAKRAAKIEYLYRVMDAAQLLGVKTVSTFVGHDETKTQAENFDGMARVFPPLLDYAAARGIRIGIENCPMPGWQFEGLPGNLAYSPLIWDEMFRRLPQANFGLNLDPSHLVWLGVDYLAAVKRHPTRIFHTHAKDTEIFAAKRAEYTILNSGWDTWWRYRIPGKGEIDWKKWAAALRAVGYDGALSLEHEDPEYEATEELVIEGLFIGKQNLEEAL